MFDRNGVLVEALLLFIEKNQEHVRDQMDDLYREMDSRQQGLDRGVKNASDVEATPGDIYHVPV